jgi:hypothetical protein
MQKAMFIDYESPSELAKLNNDLENGWKVKNLCSVVAPPSKEKNVGLANQQVVFVVVELTTSASE